MEMLRQGLVVEDLPDAAEWLQGALAQAYPGIKVHIAPTLHEGRRLLKTVRPEVALIDLSLPDGSGMDLITEARERTPPVPVIVTTIYDDEQHVFQALRAGACGYLLKEESQDSMVRRIHQSLHGELPLSPGAAQHVTRYFSGQKKIEDRAAHLTDKEREVLVLIAGGSNLDAAAEKLEVSRNTIHTHVKRIYDKLGINSRAEAALIAARLGLLRF